MAPQDGSGRVVLLGATGYTGSRIATALGGRGVDLVLAGRNAEKLASIANTVGSAQVAVLDVANRASIEHALRPGDVVVNTVGPFHLLGAAVVEAAIAVGATYFDTTGEAPFIRRVFEEYGPRAAKEGVALLTAFGSDWVPGNAAAGVALRKAGSAVDQAVRVDIGYLVTGATASSYSRGTLASGFKVGLEPSYALIDHRIREEPTAARLRYFDHDGNSHTAVSVGGTEQFAVTRTAPSVGTVNVYLGWLGPASRAVHALAPAAGFAARIPGVPAAASRLGDVLTRRIPQGPSAEAVAHVRNCYVAEVFGVDGRRLSRSVLEGPEVYAITADLLGWAADRVAKHGIHASGALGPVEAFGLDALLEGLGQAGVTPWVSA